MVKILQFPIQEIQNRKQTPDLPLLHSIIYYIEQFLDKLQTSTSFPRCVNAARLLRLNWTF